MDHATGVPIQSLYRNGRFRPNASVYRDEDCEGVDIQLVNREVFDPVLMGLELLAATIKFHTHHFEVGGAMRLLGSNEAAARLDGEMQREATEKAAGMLGAEVDLLDYPDAQLPWDEEASLRVCDLYPMWRGQTGLFRYYDYYRSMVVTRGCLSGFQYAVTLMRDPYERFSKVRSLVWIGA